MAEDPLQEYSISCKDKSATSRSSSDQDEGEAGSRINAQKLMDGRSRCYRGWCKLKMI